MNKTTTAVVCVLVAVSLIGCGNPADAAPMFGSRYRSLLPKGTPTRESLQQKMDRLRASQEKVRNSGGKVDSGFECDACDVVVGVIQELFLGEKTEEEAEAICTSVCVDLKMYNHRVCSLGVQEFKDEVLDVFDMVALSSREICGAIVGPSCATPYNPYDQEWNVSIPGNKPPITPTPPPKPGSPMNRILHLTDMHFDHLYTPGLSNDCGEPLCCRPPNPQGNVWHGATFSRSKVFAVWSYQIFHGSNLILRTRILDSDATYVVRNVL